MSNREEAVQRRQIAPGQLRQLSARLEERRAARHPFFGWRVVLGVFIIMTFTSGLGFYNLTVYLRALSVDRGLAVGAVSVPTGLFFLAVGFSGLGVARLLDRYTVRAIMAVSTLCAGLTLAVLGQVTSLWQVYVVYIVFGMSIGGASLIPTTTVITRWFVRRRSSAIALASAGLSVGGIVVTPLTARLISAHGLAAVTPWLGLAFIAIVLPVVLFFIRETPAAMGLSPDGDPAPDSLDLAGHSIGSSVGAAFRSRFFVGMCAGYFLVQMGAVGGIAHHFNLVSTRTDEAFAALAVSALAASSLVGRLLGGWIVSRTPMRVFLLGLVGLQGLGLALMGIGESPFGLLAGSVLFGASVGNLLMMETLLVAEVFGVKHYARIFSVQQLLVRFGVASGPIVMGMLFDLGGGYTAPYLGVALLSALGLALLAAAGPIRPYEPVAHVP